MKRFLLLIIFISPSEILSQQDFNFWIKNNVDVDVLVEDKSVEAVREYWDQKRFNDLMNNIQVARSNRISNWLNKPFSFYDEIRKYKYIVLIPPRKHHKDVKRNLKNKLKGLPITYINVIGPYQTHKQMPLEIRQNPESVLWLTVDLRAPYLVETYIQIYDSYGKLIYSMGKEAMSGSSAFKDFKNELSFALTF
jgi:hypothetical protein